MKPRLILAVLLYMAPAVLYLGRWSPDPIGVDAVSAVTPGHVAVVGVLTADDKALASPAALDAVLTADQVADLVGKTAYYSGGVHKALDPDAEWIIVKPGFVAGLEATEEGRQAIESHALVVAGALRLIHRASPEAEISVVTGLAGNATLDARLAELVGGAPLAGAQVNLLNMGEEEHEEMEVPDGGENADTYPVPIALLECDAVINVARVTGPGQANGMANLWGFARIGEETGPLPDQPDDGVLVDLALLSEVDFTILDLLVIETADGLKRLNMMAAGRDMISVDRIGLALPASGSGGLKALILASARSLGQVDIGDIKVNGVPVEGTWVEATPEVGAAGGG